MAWIELHQTLPNNKKLLRLKRLLKIKTPQAIGHLCLLWLWTLDNAPDGNLFKFSADEIAEVVEWTGRTPQVFVDGLIESGFLNADMTLHNWDNYAGKLMEQREIQREQARVRQQKRREKITAKKQERHADVTRDNGVSHADVTHIPYPTLPYPTVPKDNGSSCCSNSARENEPEPAEEAAQKLAAPQDQEPLYDKAISSVMTFYMDKINPSPSSGSTQELLEFIPILGPDVTIKAMSIALDERKPQWSYIRGILRAWVSQGVKTLEDVQRIQDERDRQRASTFSQGNKKITSNPFLESLMKEQCDE